MPFDNPANITMCVMLQHIRLGNRNTWLRLEQLHRIKAVCFANLYIDVSDLIRLSGSDRSIYLAYSLNLSYTISYEIGFSRSVIFNINIRLVTSMS